MLPSRPALLLAAAVFLAGVSPHAMAQGFDLLPAAPGAAPKKTTPVKAAPPKTTPAKTTPAKSEPKPRHTPPQAQPAPTPFATQQASPKPLASTTPTPKAPPAPETPTKAEPATPALYELWRPLGLAVGLVGALLALAAMLRLVRRVKAPRVVAATIRNAEAAAETPPPTPPIIAAEPDPKPAPHGFKPSPLFADLPDETPPKETAPKEAAPTPVSPLPPAALVLHLAAKRFATSLAQASLRYEMVLENQSDEPLGPLAIHATLVSPDNNMAGGGAAGEEDIHRLILIHAGGSHSFSGEVRLPLASIAPVALADMQLFVPVLRIMVEARRVSNSASNHPLQYKADFLVGMAQGDQGLAPFRLDDGPITATALVAHRTV